MCIRDSFSGASRGASIGHVSPEAAAGGPIGLVQTGDMIKIDIPNYSIELLVDEQTLEKRKKEWKPVVKDVPENGYLRRYRKMVTDASQGAIFHIED